VESIDDDLPHGEAIFAKEDDEDEDGDVTDDEDGDGKPSLHLPHCGHEMEFNAAVWTLTRMSLPPAKSRFPEYEPDDEDGSEDD
jgi:hypothetical protein